MPTILLSSKIDDVPFADLASLTKDEFEDGKPIHDGTLAVKYEAMADPWRSTRGLFSGKRYTEDEDRTEYFTSTRALLYVMWSLNETSSWFRTDDMDIDSLQRIGKLRIKWSHAADHLKLEISDSDDGASSCDGAPSEDLGTALHLA